MKPIDLVTEAALRIAGDRTLGGAFAKTWPPCPAEMECQGKRKCAVCKLAYAVAMVEAEKCE